MIKKENMYCLIIISILFVALFAYEIHLFAYYSLSQLLISAFLFLLLFAFIRSSKKYTSILLRILKKQKYIFFLLLMMVVNTLLGHLFYNYNSVTNILSSFMMLFTTVGTFYVIPILMEKYPKIEKKFFDIFRFVSLGLAIFAVAMEFNGGTLLGYKEVYYRGASIYYDPNFFGVTLGLSFICFFFSPYKKYIKIPALLLISYAIFLTGSRGTLLSIILAIIAYVLIFSKISNSKKILATIILISVALVILNYLLKADFFRLYQGSNHRFEMIIDTIKATIKSPIFGYGYGSMKKYLLGIGYVNFSSHNSFIDYMFNYGFICLLLYLYLIVSILLKSIKYKKKVQSIHVMLLIFSIINANTILYSFGGVGLASFIFTLIMGILNLKLNKGEDCNAKN